jgi:hypothetical protein
LAHRFKARELRAWSKIVKEDFAHRNGSGVPSANHPNSMATHDHQSNMISAMAQEITRLVSSSDHMAMKMQDLEARLEAPSPRAAKRPCHEERASSPASATSSAANEAAAAMTPVNKRIQCSARAAAIGTSNKGNKGIKVAAAPEHGCDDGWTFRK